MFVGIVHSSKYEKKSKKLRLNLMMSSLALATLIPVNFAFAEEVATSDETSEKVKITNESTLNWLDSEDYLITAERIPSSKWETPANVYVITAQDIEENHYQSVEEALSHINGVMTVTSGTMTSGEVYMNGNARVLLLINGHRANNTQDGFTSRKSELTVIPSMKMIERIEIVKGGSSALYGTDAVDGVINIITKKGTRDETTIDLNAGSWHKYNVEFTNQGVVGKFGWFVSGGLGRSHAYNYKGPGTDILSDGSDYSDNDFTIRMDHQFTDRNSLNLEMLHRSHHYNSKLSSGIYNNVSLSYNFKESTSVPGWLRYYNNYRTTSTAGGVNTDATIQGLEYQNGWEFGSHKIIAGFEYHQNKLDQKYYGINGEKFNNTAFYVQDTIKFGKKWTVIPGTRYDHSSKFGHNWSPKIAANYQPDEKTKFYASWGRVYREPTLSERYSNNLWILDYDKYQIPYLGGDTYYDTFLRSEKGHTETVGVEHDFDENTNIAFNFFNSNINNGIYWGKNAIGYIYDDMGTPIDYLYAHVSENLLNEKRRGIELTFRQKLNDHFSYNLGYSHTKVKNRILDVEASDDYGQPNGYRIGLHYKNRGLRVNLLGIMASGLNIVPDDNRLAFASKNYVVLGLNVSYDINEHTLIYFKANNFTNQNYSNVSKQWHSPGRCFMSGAVFRF